MAGLTVLGREVEALLLDLDGTLVDSEPIQQEGFRRFFAARDWALDDDLLRRFTGRRADDVFAGTEGPWTGEDPVALFHEVVSHVPTDVLPQPVAGALALLDAADQHGVPSALVTSAGRDWVDTAFHAFGGADRLACVVTRDDVDHGKPAPHGYLLAARRLGVEPGRCLAAEDTPAGVEAARAAGVGLVVGVTSTFAADALTAAGADIALPHLSALTAT